jgi:hypothetical protein
LAFHIGSGLFWGWGWLAGVGVIIMLGIFLLPWFYFLMNLQALLNQVSEPNRKMSPGQVWLNFIPVFNLGWFVYTVIKVKDSVNAEFQTRGWYVDGDLGYNVGLTAGILWIAAFFIGWIPFIGWVLPLGGVICWIIYWLKVSDLKSRFDSNHSWNQFGVYSAVFPPYATRYPHGYAARTAGDAGGASEAGRTDDEATGGETGADEPLAGKPIAGDQTRICAACGSRYDEADQFCRVCGIRLPRGPYFFDI